MTRELTYPRPRHAHKGTFGHVGIIAGSRNMSGAAALSAGAALSSGVGLTTVATREAVRPTVLANFPEAMVIPCLPESGPLDDASGEALGAYIEGKSAFAVGPGLGQDEGTAEILDAVLAQAHSPVVLDADALNVLANDLGILDNTYCPVILTPHPGEMSRLTNTPVDVGMRAPIEWAFRLAEYTGSYVILKFSTTVICAPDGRYAINTSGNAGMATGGTGDVLTGLLAGLLGSGMTTWDACRLAVFAHGRAGDLAREKVGQRALRAGHLIEFLPGAMAFLESERSAK
jgi:NAD(P)H-hydrate epimerase